MPRNKVYYRLLLRDSAGSEHTVNVVAMSRADAMAQIEAEFDAPRPFVFDERNPLMASPLPVYLFVEPLDTGKQVSCWSSQRVDDFIAGKGLGLRGDPKLSRVERFIVRKLLHVPCVETELEFSARANGYWWATRRVRKALCALERAGIVTREELPSTRRDGSVTRVCTLTG